MTTSASRSTDLVIVGAGPAGSSLAIGAGRAGLSVDLLDAARFPRDKPCGEGIMPAGVRALARLGLGDACGGARFWGVRYRGFGIDVVADFPSGADDHEPPFGLGQRRLILDRALVDLARATPGVRVFEDARVDGLVSRHGRVVGVRAKERTHLARLTVGADGAGSTVRRLLELDAPPAPYHHARVGWRLHFKLASDRAPGTHVEIYVGRGHEIYVTPLPDGRVLVAALTSRAAPIHNAQATLRQWISEHPDLARHLAGATVISTARGRAPLVHGARAGVAPGAVLLGDAAGNADPITGGGISQALMSSEILSGMLPSALAGRDTEYDGDWLHRFDRRRRAMLRDYRMLTAGLVQVARVPALSRAVLHAMRAQPAVMRHLVGVAAGLRPLLSGNRERRASR